MMKPHDTAARPAATTNDRDAGVRIVALHDALRDGALQQSGVPGERLVDLLYRNIRDYVIFSPEGTHQRRLYPHDLCEKFHATATPVREALARLAAEGFIEATPRRGFHIRRPTEAQVTDLWQVRGGLEVLAGEIVIGHLQRGSLQPAQLDPLATLLERIATTVEGLDGHAHIELNRQFHGGIIELSGNQLLVSMYRGIQMQLLAAWVKRGLQTWRARVQAEADDHGEILAALRALEPERYRVAARQHVVMSLGNALMDLGKAEQRQTLAPQSGEAAHPNDQPNT